MIPESRVASLRARMAEHGLDAVALASPELIYYLTGLDHHGYFAFTLLVVPRDGDLALVTREMERPTVRAQVPQCRHVTFGDGTDPATAVAGALADVPAGGRIATEDAAIFFPPAIHARARLALPGRRWTDATPLLTGTMAVKTADEVELVRAAAAISDAAMAAGTARAREGTAEHDVAAAVHHALYSTGGQQPGFVPMIRPLWMLEQEHVSWGPRTLTRGTGLFLELSGCVRRYHAPLSRTVYVGDPPEGAAEAHAAALAGLEAARATLRPGVRTGDVYAAWHAAAGVTVPRHHCGYLVGIGFPPSWVGGGEVLGIRPGGDTRVRAGMTFHLMSWVPGHVVSDTALVTSERTEFLTRTSRDLTVVS
ncbi:Xaa-Pro peptidase family protein [Prauserella sp. PE36]|uniref:M24 family metallopeptidase n=1 Tax=Prauserella sp. PE36 TaxID=1504709 RepID=UPI0011BD56FC|nr:Xaa-Pro peptidase family protein [Prauserella sp. PE36]